jgi:hypothetical protein
MPAPQQEARQREEDRDGEVEAAEYPADDSSALAGLERDVGDDDADGRTRAQAFDGGQKPARSTDGLAFGRLSRCAHRTTVCPQCEGAGESPG